MRLNRALIALASLVSTLPLAALAQEAARPPPPRPEAAAPPAPAPRPAPEARPVYPPDARRELSPDPRYRPAPGRPYVGRPYVGPYYRPHRWWGWGWGWYPVYPYYPAPPPSEGYAPAPEPERREQDRIYTRLSLYGAGRSDGYMGGLTVGLEGRLLGFDVDVAALAREQVTGPLHSDTSDPATWTTAHLTWTLVNERSVRLRLETGASILALPDSPAVANQEWRGKTLVGPDVGISGHLGLVGPLGIEGYARLTPVPTRVADTFVGLAVHGGPLGVSAGWRWVDVAGNGRDAPKLMFRGPQVGIGLAF